MAAVAGLGAVIAFGVYAALPPGADAALPPPPAKSRATWWGADMGVVNVSQHVFTRPGNSRFTLSGTVLNGGVGGPRWVWTDSGWAASGIYQVKLSGPGATVSYAPPANSNMSVGYNYWDGWVWNDINDGTCPVPYEGWHGQPDVPGTNRFPTGTTFSVTSDISQTIPNQWLRVTSYFRGNIGYLHWGATASDYIAIISGDTHLAVAATPTQVPGDGETTAAVTATLKDDAGDPIPGETIRLALSDSRLGTLSDTAPTTDASGVAQAVFTSKHTTGTVTVTAEQDDESANVPIEVIPANEIRGTASDGNGHALVDARVELFEGTSTAARETVVTGNDGSYAFTPFVMEDNTQYRVKLSLQDKDADPSDFRILWGNPGGDAIFAQKSAIKDDADANGAIVRDFNFSNTNGMTLTPGIAPADMNDIAAIYFHTGQANFFWRVGLNKGLNYSMPEDVIVGQAGNGAYHENPWNANHDIYIQAGNAGYGNLNRPVNREWHEFAHHAQFDMYVPPAASPWPWHSTDQNHAGWANDCTADSFVEAWAEYSSLLMKDSGFFTLDAAGGVTPSWVYAFNGGAVDMELNQNYVANRGAVVEEDVVARILWDLTDSDATYPNGPDDENVTLSLTTMDTVIGRYRANLREIYDALIALDDSVITDARVNAIFLLQGAYYDVDGDQTYDVGEPIGRLAEAGRPSREARPPMEGTGVGLNLRTSTGGTVRDGVAAVTVDYEDASLRDFTYEQPLESTSAPVLYLSMPASDTAATVTVRMKNTDDVTASAVATVTPDEFWEAHDAWAAREDSSTADVIMTKDFTVAKASSSIRISSVASGTSARVTYGGYLTVTGELEPYHPGARVYMYWRPVRSTRWTYVTSTQTSSLGSFSMRARPLTRGTLLVRYGGDTDHSASSRSLGVLTEHKVSWGTAVSTVSRGRTFYFSGSVSPNHYLRRVALQRRTSTGSWVTVAYATLNYRSRYRGAWRPTVAGTYRLRVALGTDTYHYIGESAHRTLTVR